MKVAIFCSGLDDVFRGYERHQRMLCDGLKSSMGVGKIYLYKRSGVKSESEIVTFTPSKSGNICKFFSLISEDRSFWQCLFFSIVSICHLRIFNRDVKKIFVIEPAVSRVLSKLSFMISGIEVIYTHGLANSPVYYVWHADTIIEVTRPAYDKMCEYAANNKLKKKYT